MIRAGGTRRFLNCHTTGGVPAPVNTVLPVISGTEIEGETLTCSTGTWTGTGITYTYQWEREGTPIGGATNNTYTLQAADVGNTLTCVVTATNAGGSASAESDPTGTIAAANPVVASLSFTAASSQYLSTSNANWGSYTRSKYALAFSVRITSLPPDTYTIVAKAAGDTTGEEFWININSSGRITFSARQSGGGFGSFTSPTSTITTNTWYSVLIHYDQANATSTDRIKMWVNNSSQSALSYPAPTAATQTTTSDVTIGTFKNTEYMGGLVYSLAFFDNVLPDPSVIFDGTAGKLLNLSGITGLKSLLTGSTATDDYLLTDWTNNGTVTTSATVP